MATSVMMMMMIGGGNDMDNDDDSTLDKHKHNLCAVGEKCRDFS